MSPANKRRIDSAAAPTASARCGQPALVRAGRLGERPPVATRPSSCKADAAAPVERSAPPFGGFAAGRGGVPCGHSLPRPAFMSTADLRPDRPAARPLRSHRRRSSTDVGAEHRRRPRPARRDRLGLRLAARPRRHRRARLSPHAGGADARRRRRHEPGGDAGRHRLVDRPRPVSPRRRGRRRAAAARRRRRPSAPATSRSPSAAAARATRSPAPASSTASAGRGRPGSAARSTA